MRFSHSNMLSPNMGLIEELQPRSALDVGMGFDRFLTSPTNWIACHRK